MEELVIEKRHNPVMDLSIAYGLLHILTENDAEATLKNYPGAYVIQYDNFDPDETYLEAPLEGWVNFGRFLNRRNMEKMIQSVYGSDEEESSLLKDGALASIIEYYGTPVPDRDIKKVPKHASKKGLIGIIGSWYGGKGQRTNGNATTGYRVMLFERWLAEIGFIQSVSFTSIGDNDFLLWMGVPSEQGVSEVRLFEDKYADKETGEVRRRQYIRAHSVEIALAATQLSIQDKMAKDNIQAQYNGALFMRGWFNGNTGSPDWVTLLPWYPVQETTLQALIMHMTSFPRDKKIDLQHALSTWLLDQKKQGFYDTVHVLAKEGRPLDSNESEDYMTMANLKDLHTNPGIIKLGNVLNDLMYRKRGYGLSVDLMDVHTKKDLMSVVSNMGVEFEKLHNGAFPLWATNEYDSFLESVDDDYFHAKDIASAILLRSKTRKF